MKQGPEAAEPGTMFVQEEKIFAGKVLRLHVCTMEGAEWLEEVPEDTTVEKLKERCLKHVRNRVSRPVPGAGAAPCAPGEPSGVCGRGEGKSRLEERAGKSPWEDKHLPKGKKIAEVNKCFCVLVPYRKKMPV